ncbi:FecR family protein [Brevundimonas diminuta ATCC 11568]|jgi:transmembrane sensor
MTIQADIRRKEATDWFARLNQRKVTTADIQGFSDWRRDPENARAFSRVEAMWDAAGTLAKDPAMAALADDAIERADRRRRGRAKGLSDRLLPLGAAGAVALALGAAGLFWWSAQPVVYGTGIGEQRTVRLDDGSRIILDTGSRVSVRLSGSSRVVSLTSGRALFDVEADASRPFMVQAGDTQVIAVGTRFDVRRTGEGARVVLVEGRVDVRKPTSSAQRWSLSPGQLLTTSASAPRVVTANVPAETSWTLGRLTFERTPIATAVAEMNRYSVTPIELHDARVSAVLVSGVFDAGDVDGFVAALGDLYNLEVTTAADGRLVLTAPT